VTPRGPAAEREPEPEAARARVTVMQGEAIA